MPENELDFDDEMYQPRAVLVVTAPELDTEALTQGLGLQPVHSWLQGEFDDEMDEMAEESGWVYAATLDGTEPDPERHLVALLDQIEPKRAVLDAAVSGGAIVLIDLQWTCNLEGTSNPILQAGTLARLAALGVPIELSPSFDNDFFFGAGLEEDWEFDDEDEEPRSNGKQ